MARTKLATRMTIHVALVLVAALGASGFLSIRAQRQTLVDEARRAALTAADAFEGTMRDFGAPHPWREIRRAARRAAAQPRVDRVRLIDADGLPRLGSDESSEGDLAPPGGEALPLDDAACAGCHGADPSPRPHLPADRRTHLDRDRRLIRAFAPIPNEPQCATCHADGRRVLGLIEVEAPMRPIDALVADSLDTTLLISAIATVVAAFLGGLALTRWLAKPVAALVEGTRRVAEGDLEHRIPGERNDELGLLCDAFNRMTERLKESRLLLLRSEKLSSLGKLAAGVAHEINNPLTGILSFAEDLKEDLPEDDPKQEDLDVIVRESLRCRNIVRRLLDFSRPEAPEFERVALNQVTRQSLALVSRQAGFQNVRVELLLEPELPFVYAEAGQLQQIVLNLLVNARDAVGRRGTITITSRSHSYGDRVELVIDDSGPGVPEELQEKIFEPFFSTKRDRGSGIGLGVSRSIAEAHGGHLLVARSPAGGARFRLILPTRRPDEPLP
jgi:two-component system NtrC family sensor kinase